MKRPDFKELHRLLENLHALSGGLSGIFDDEEHQLAQVRLAAAAAQMVRAKRFLAEISVEELKNSRAGIRVPALAEAGYQNLAQLDAASDEALAAVDGVGEKQVASIRRIIHAFAQELAAGSGLRLDEGVSTPENAALVTALARIRRGDAVRAAASDGAKDFQAEAAAIEASVRIHGPLRWLFSGKEAKEETLAAADWLYVFLQGPLAKNAADRIRDYQAASALSAAEAHADFEKNGAEFYALLERFADVRPPAALIYSSIPEALAAEVDAEPLDLSAFRGNLRAYQSFGAKYILHQRRVLLGDEMGLGKTVTAIAAVADRFAADASACFLIVCPAAVLVNWCREIARFSAMPCRLLHGPSWAKELEAWQAGGGAAVTNYESMGKVADRIDNAMRLSMLIVDEAHYMKNPDAQRTRNIRRLEEEADRILLMTGTPLENRVEEMCTLLDFVRPDMTERIRNAAFMHEVPAFREMLSPVYLRRLRKDVLSELPPVDERQEWCPMTPQDRIAYAVAVQGGSFPTVRRVSFLQEDPQTSAKTQRLLELCRQAAESGRRVIVYSFFRETIRRVQQALGDACFGVLSGETPAAERQEIVDRFGEAPAGSVLAAQVQAGGTGLNIQAASIVIFCEPQIKPSLTQQALSRVYRMGQVHNVLVYHLLCEGTVDEAVCELLEKKQLVFDEFAMVSSLGEASADLADREWIHAFLESERQKYAAEPDADAGLKDGADETAGLREAGDKNANPGISNPAENGYDT